MPIYKNKVFIILVILLALVIAYFIFGKNLITPPRASETLTLYNIESRYGDGLDNTVMPTRTVRWQNLPVAIYNGAGVKNLQAIIDEWNQAMGQEVFKIGGSDSPIVISDNPEITPAGILSYSFKNFLLNRVEIIGNVAWLNNPELADPELTKNPNNGLKKALGRALGFFGYTTDDPDSVMDVAVSAKEKVTVTLFVVSVLKELYSLPAGTRAAKSLNPQLKWLVKKYNIDARYADYIWDTIEEHEDYNDSGKLPKTVMPIITMRWRSLPVAVYDKNNMVPSLKSIINEWNTAMGQEVFKIGGSDSPIVIEADITRPPVELVVWTPEKNSLIDKVKIINNPNWVSYNKIKHQLGHALGFFGHTTDDPEGVMDPDYDKEKTISPLVISVLKELYRLPPAIRIVDEFGRADQEILVLRQAIRKYNIEPRTNQDSELKEIVRTIRWRSLPVSIYNQANVPNLQAIIDEWNTAMGQEVFKIGGSDSPIVIEADESVSIQSNIDSYYTEFKNYLTTLFKIKVNPQESNFYFLRHQLGHALGFFGHTSSNDDSNGIMDSDYTKTDTKISPFVVSVLEELYCLSPAILISY